MNPKCVGCNFLTKILYTIGMLAVWFKTIFSFRAYERLCRAGAWKTAFFMLYLGLMGVLVFNIYFAWKVHQNLPLFIQHFPALTFEKGRLLIQEQALLPIPAAQQYIAFAPDNTPVPAKNEFLDKHLVAFIRADRFYMPSLTGITSQPIPPEIDGKIDANTLQKYAPALRNILQTFAFLAGFLIVGGFFLFSFLLAWSVCFFWRAITHRPVSLGVITRWAVFLQGPVLALWIVHLCYGVPLFFFAVFILLNIYVQQIFNILPDDRGSYAA